MPRWRWYVPDAFIPSESSGVAASHESVCVLNDGDRPASLCVTAYFADREPLTSLPITVAPRRDVHLRTDDPAQLGGLELRRGVPYALRIESDEEVQVQYSRLDTTGGGYTLMTAIPPASRDDE